MTAKEFDELHIGRSWLNGKIYIGTAKIDDEGNGVWKRKKDATDEFETVMIQHLLALEEFTYQLKDGRIYKGMIKEVKE